MKVTNLTTSPESFQDLRGKLIEATEDELVICQFTSAAVFIGKNADEEKVTRKVKGVTVEWAQDGSENITPEMGQV